MNEPVKCPSCGSTKFVQMTTGIYTHDYYEWDEKRKAYVHVDDDTDGGSDWSFECTDCNEPLDEEKHQQIVENVATFKTDN